MDFFFKMTSITADAMTMLKRGIASSIDVGNFPKFFLYELLAVVFFPLWGVTMLLAYIFCIFLNIKDFYGKKNRRTNH